MFCSKALSIWKGYLILLSANPQSIVFLEDKSGRILGTLTGVCTHLQDIAAQLLAQLEP
jgi:hypothetical protein